LNKINSFIAYLKTDQTGIQSEKFHFSYKNLNSVLTRYICNDRVKCTLTFYKCNL
jgi:hypothetical protein